MASGGEFAGHAFSTPSAPAAPGPQAPQKKKSYVKTHRKKRAVKKPTRRPAHHHRMVKKGTGSK